MDFLQTPVTDTARPFRDSDLSFRRRWFRVPWGTPTLGYPTAFSSHLMMADPWAAVGVGEVYPPQLSYERRGTPDGLPTDHVCGTPEDFQLGALLNPTTHVVYDGEWIPTCCGRDHMCVTTLCEQHQVHDRPASQEWVYPVPHQDATAATPVTLDQQALNQGDNLPAWPGTLTSWYPIGTAGDPVHTREMVADDSGALQFQVETWRFAADAAVTQRQLQTGPEWTVQAPGGTGTAQLQVMDGALRLIGDNFQVSPSVLPPDVVVRSQATITATGTNQATAAAIAATVTSVVPAAVPAGVRLPAWPGGTVYLKWQGPLTDSFRLYPDAGSRLNGNGVNAPIVLSVPPTETSVWQCVRGDSLNTIFSEPNWTVTLVDDATASGTVTSVDLATSSVGLVVGGGPVTGAGALTVDLAPELEALVAFPAADAILAGDGAGNWVAATIGDWLTFVDGVLGVVPPGATSGEFVGAQFVISAASAAWQATGQTFTLPGAGTYLLTGKIRGEIMSAAAGTHFISAKVRNVTAGADLANSETILTVTNAPADHQSATAGFTARVVTSGAETFELYAMRFGSAWTVSQISSDANGRTVIDWTRIA